MSKLVYQFQGAVKLFLSCLGVGCRKEIDTKSKSDKKPGAPKQYLKVTQMNILKNKN